MSFAALKLKYVAWAEASVGPEKAAAIQFDELGYPSPGFDEIENEFKAIALSGAIRTLSEADLEGLLYLIARKWDDGRMIAWLSKGPQLSNVAALAPEDALYLAEATLRPNVAGHAYDDARTQFAAILPRISITDPNVQRLLRSFFDSGNSYTRRTALTSLAKIRSPNTRELVAQLWKDGDEFAQITCLHVIEELEDDRLLDEYLAFAEELPGDHLAKHVEDALVRRSVRPR